MSSYERDDYDQPEQSSDVRNRVTLPAIFLIVVGIFNILGSFWIIGNSSFNAFASDDTLRHNVEVTRDVMRNLLGPEAAKEASIESTRRSAHVGLGFGVLMLLGSIVTILGGVWMRSLQGYGLALTGAIIACIPCLSTMSCCCGIGMGIGIWNLVVLLNPQVQAAFRGDVVE